MLFCGSFPVTTATNQESRWFYATFHHWLTHKPWVQRANCHTLLNEATHWRMPTFHSGHNLACIVPSLPNPRPTTFKPFISTADSRSQGNIHWYVLAGLSTPKLATSSQSHAIGLPFNFSHLSIFKCNVCMKVSAAAGNCNAEQNPICWLINQCYRRDDFRSSTPFTEKLFSCFI